MTNLIIVFFIIYISLGGVFIKGEEFERCSGTDWVHFNDKKCFKLVKSFTTGLEAADACKKESIDSNLAVINSPEEQNYITNYIFEEMSSTINVWFGLVKKVDGGFSWIDDSPLTYLNWAPGNPTNQSVRACIEMISEFSRSNNGEWKDASCDKPNFVICEKLQSWSILELQKDLLKLRAESSWRNEELMNELEVFRTETAQYQDAANLEINKLKANPVPIGFIYVQLKDQPVPSATWPQVTWTEISSSYAGLFFRVGGGTAAGFGQIQTESSPSLMQVRRTGSEILYQNTPISITRGSWSEYIHTGSSAGSVHHRLSFFVSNTENRPTNTAIKIWKRTA